MCVCANQRITNKAGGNSEYAGRLPTFIVVAQGAFVVTQNRSFRHANGHSGGRKRMGVV